MLKLIQNLALVSIVFFALSGCSRDTIKEQVDKKFPPVDVAQYREKAILTGASSLLAMQSPDLAVFLRFSDVRRAIENTDILKKTNINDINIEGDRQILLVDIHFDGIITSSMFPDIDVDNATILESLKPNLAGVLKIGVSITSAIAEGDNSGLTLEFQALPLFREIQVKRLTINDDVELDKPAEFIVRIINQFADNITGELSRAKFAKITVPASPVGSLKTSVDDSLTMADGTKVELSLTGQPISSPLFAKAVSFRIDNENVAILAKLATSNETPPAPSSPDPIPSFLDFSTAYDGRLSELVAVDDQPTTTWVALSKSSLSHLLNSGFQEANLCLEAKASVPKQEFSEKIEIPDENTIDCTPTKDCTPTRDCTPNRNCEQTEDCRQTRDCTPHRNCEQTEECKQEGDCSGRQIDCGGYQWYQAPDKLRCETEKKAWIIDCERIKAQKKADCEVKKVARKADCERLKTQEKVTCEIEKKAAHDACEMQKAARKLNCERLKAQEKFQCETEKTAEKTACEAEKTATKGLCEAGKESLKRLSRTGNLANVDSFAQATGLMNICSTKVVFDPMLTSVEMTLDIEGQADARVGIKWVPLDILGHATCPVKWTEHKDLKVTVPHQKVEIRNSLEYETLNEESLWITAEVKTSELKAKLRPSPRDLILKSYNMQLACPLVGALVGTVHNASALVDVSGAIPEMSGDFIFPGEKRKFEIEIKPIIFDLPNMKVRGKTSIKALEGAVMIDFQYTD